MKPIRKICISILFSLFSVFIIIPSSYASAYTWSNNIQDSMRFSFPAAGWGSASYNMTNLEDYSYNNTYQTGSTKRRQVALKVNPACPYTCEIRFTNTYTNSNGGSLLAGITSYSYSPGSYWTLIQPAGTINSRNSQSMSSIGNSHINLRSTLGLYVNNSGWVFLGSKNYYGNLR